MVVIVVHCVADGHASAIGTWPAVTSTGALDFAVAGSKGVARPLSSTATHSVADGHWTCSSDCPSEVSTGRGADHVSVAAAAVEAATATAPSAARIATTRAIRG